MIVTITPEAKEHLSQGTRVKFVMIGPSRSPEQEEVTCHIFSGEYFHADTVKLLLNDHGGMIQVGGGKIEGSDVWWDSPSFRDEFGYDQPEGRMTGELLLQALEEALPSL